MLHRSFHFVIFVLSVLFISACDSSANKPKAEPTINEPVVEQIKELNAPFEPTLDQQVNYLLEIGQPTRQTSGYYNTNQQDERAPSQVILSFKAISHDDQQTVLELTITRIVRQISLGPLMFTIDLSDDEVIHGKISGQKDDGTEQLRPVIANKEDNALGQINALYKKLLQEKFIITLDKEGGFVKLTSPEPNKLDPQLAKLKGEKYEERLAGLKTQLWIFSDEQLSKILTFMFPARTVQPVKKGNHWTSLYKLSNNGEPAPVIFTLLPIVNNMQWRENFNVVKDFERRSMMISYDGDDLAGVVYKASLSNKTEQNDERVSKTIYQSTYFIGRTKNWLIEGLLKESSSVSIRMKTKQGLAVQSATNSQEVTIRINQLSK